MIDRALALSGPPGSGKTTAARALARVLKLEIFSAGERFRAEAARRGMDLAQFSRFAGSHPEIDIALDEAMVAQARPGTLLEGRVQGALLRARGVPVHWLAVTAAFEVRVGRVAGRDGLPPARAADEIRGREASERTRYRALYGFDIDVMHPDCEVNASSLSPSEVVSLLLDHLKAVGATDGA